MSKATAYVPEPRRVSPASFAQQRLWFIDQLDPGNPVYSVSRAVELRGPLDVAALRGALGVVVERHETLRTTFGEVGGVPVQLVARATPLPIATIDVSGLQPERGQAEVARIVETEARRPFDLAAGPLFRITLVKRAEEDHVLLIALHHIVADGWSMAVLLGEVSDLYASSVEGRVASPPDLPMQYTEYVAWQRAWLEGDALAAHLDFWKQRLDGAPLLLRLPLDRPRPSTLSSRGAMLPVELSETLTAELKRLAARKRVSLYMVLLAAFETLLHRYSGQQDLLVGTPIACRTRREIEPVIGLFVNTLVMRADFSGDPTFGELLARVRKDALGAFAHQDLPFDRLVQELHPDRDMSRMPVFQVMFAFQSDPLSRLVLPRIEVTPIPLHNGTAKFDMFLSLEEGPSGVRGTLEYSTDLFARATMERLAGHFLRLLESAAAEPERPVWELEMLGEDERERLVVGFNATDAPYPSDRCIHDLVSEQADRTPDRVAVEHGSTTLTYASLLDTASRIASHLLAAGLEPEEPVAVAVARGPDLVPSFLGVLQAGGAYLPIDTTYPEARLRLMLEDAFVRFVVASDDAVCHGAWTGLRVLRVADLLGEPAPDAPAPPRVQADALAYVIYTSGSTGRPKAVAIEHRNAVALLAWARSAYTDAELSRVVASTSVCFDLSVFELWAPLTVGGTTVIVDDALQLASDSFSGSVSLLNTVPSAAEELIRLGYAGDGLLVVNLAGEPLSRHLVRRIHEAWPVRKVFDLYGPSETTTYSTGCLRSPVGPDRIGRPLPNERVYVLGSRRELVPVGVPGEIYIGGAGVARGYLNADSPAFLSDFVRGDGSRLYRTGDLGRWHDDGTLEYLGRSDDQIKLRGFRVELAEIEHVLGLHPAVRSAVVLVRNRQETSFLVAYVVPDKQQVDEDAAGARSDEALEHVEQWRGVWDEIYSGEREEAEAGFDVVGWNSSYTNLPIPAAEMRDWVRHTLDRVRALAPRRVLEIGCGTGLLLFGLAPDCDEYAATDFSQAALDALERGRVRTRKALAHVTTARRSADDFSGVAPGQFDTVILNSVAQYFPSAAYLATVIQSAVNALAPGGSMFLGDIRNLRLARALHLSVLASRASEDTTVADLRDQVRAGVARETELLLDPDFFVEIARRLGRSVDVEIQLKRGSVHNELTRFRYDVTIRCERPALGAAVTRLNWGSDLTRVEELRALLASGIEFPLRVVGVPNGRLSAEIGLLDLLDSSSDDTTLRDLLDALGQVRGMQGVDPEDLWALAGDLPYDVVVTWSAEAEERALDVEIRRRRPSKAGPSRTSNPSPGASCGSRAVASTSWAAYANAPLNTRLTHEMLPSLRAHIGEHLPAHMMPSAFVFLESIPRLPNGKVNKSALPPLPSERTESEKSYVGPRGVMEETLARIWRDLLGITRIGVRDNFFDLGGHSLLATQLVSRIRKALGIDLPLRAVFEAPTIAGLGERVEALGAVANRETRARSATAEREVGWL